MSYMTYRWVVVSLAVVQVGLVTLGAVLAHFFELREITYHHFFVCSQQKNVTGLAERVRVSSQFVRANECVLRL